MKLRALGYLEISLLVDVFFARNRTLGGQVFWIVCFERSFFSHHDLEERKIMHGLKGVKDSMKKKSFIDFDLLFVHFFSLFRNKSPKKTGTKKEQGKNFFGGEKRKKSKKRCNNKNKTLRTLQTSTPAA